MLHNVTMLPGDYNFIRIPVAAGRVNCSWNNATNRLWQFPAGTVLYADGVTPIEASTAEKPDVTIPAGGGVITLCCDRWAGNYTFNANDSGARVRMSLADFRRKLAYAISLYFCSLVTGSLSDLQGRMTSTLNLTNCSLVTGSLSDLQGRMTSTLSLSGCSLVTGSLSDLQGKLTNSLYLAGCSLVTGSLADLQGKLTNILDLTECTSVTGAYTPVGNGVPNITILTDTGLSAADMDATLIAYNTAAIAINKTGKTFTAVGKTRTAASNAAYTNLTIAVGSGGLGWTVTNMTVV